MIIFYFSQDSERIYRKEEEYILALMGLYDALEVVKVLAYKFYVQSISFRNSKPTVKL